MQASQTSCVSFWVLSFSFLLCEFCSLTFYMYKKYSRGEKVWFCFRVFMLKCSSGHHGKLDVEECRKAVCQCLACALLRIDFLDLHMPVEVICLSPQLMFKLGLLMYQESFPDLNNKVSFVWSVSWLCGTDITV